MLIVNPQSQSNVIRNSFEWKKRSFAPFLMCYFMSLHVWGMIYWHGWAKSVIIIIILLTCSNKRGSCTGAKIKGSCWLSPEFFNLTTLHFPFKKLNCFQIPPSQWFFYPHQATLLSSPIGDIADIRNVVGVQKMTNIRYDRRSYIKIMGEEEVLVTCFLVRFPNPSYGVSCQSNQTTCF